MKLAERDSQQGGHPAVTRSASDAASWSTVSLDVRCPRGVAEACLRVLLKGARRWQVAGASAHQESTTPRRFVHIDPYSLDRSRRFRRESTAILTLSPKETWPWTSISKPSLWHCTSSWTIFTRATSNPACPPVVGQRHR